MTRTSIHRSIDRASLKQQRTTHTNGINGDAATHTVQIGGGSLSISRSGSGSRICALSFFYPLENTEGPDFDASPYDTLEFDVTSIAGSITCTVSIDYVKSGFGLSTGLFNMTTTGAKSAAFPAPFLPLPADSTSLSFQCLTDANGESIVIENLRLS